VTLDQELYYKISCEPVKGYCLRVSNCSVTTDAPGQKPYLIIDGRGCTTEPSLFEHVQVSWMKINFWGGGEVKAKKREGSFKWEIVTNMW